MASIWAPNIQHQAMTRRRPSCSFSVTLMLLGCGCRKKKMGSYSVLPPIWFMAFWFIGPAMWGWVIFAFKTSCHFGESGHPLTSYDSGYHEWWHSRWTASPSNAFNFSILAAARTSFWVRPENWGFNGLTKKNGV